MLVRVVPIGANLNHEKILKPDKRLSATGFKYQRPFFWSQMPFLLRQ
jgi:hypothetical protein